MSVQLIDYAPRNTAAAQPTGKAPMARALAREIALELIGLLKPACERIQLAGSIRRRRELVGDIELLAVPRTIEQRDLLGEVTGAVDALHVRCDELLALGVLAKRRSDKGLTHYGPASKRLVYRGVPVDLFVCEAGNFGMHLLVRTGPAKWSNRLVTPLGRRTHDGLPGLLPPGLTVAGGVWLHREGERLETPEESDAFEALELPWIEPHLRAEGLRLVVRHDARGAYREWDEPRR